MNLIKSICSGIKNGDNFKTRPPFVYVVRLFNRFLVGPGRQGRAAAVDAWPDRYLMWDLLKPIQNKNDVAKSFQTKFLFLYSKSTNGSVNLIFWRFTTFNLNDTSLLGSLEAYFKTLITIGRIQIIATKNQRNSYLGWIKCMNLFYRLTAIEVNFFLSDDPSDKWIQKFTI